MYVYIFEDNIVKQSTHPPTEVDLQCIDQGQLQVLYCAGCKNVTDIDPKDGELNLPYIEREKGYSV